MKILLEITIPDEFDEAEAREAINDLIDIGDLESTAIDVLKDRRMDREYAA